MAFGEKAVRYVLDSLGLLLLVAGASKLRRGGRGNTTVLSANGSGLGLAPTQ